MVLLEIFLEQKKMLREKVYYIRIIFDILYNILLD